MLDGMRRRLVWVAGVVVVVVGCRGRPLGTTIPEPARVMSPAVVTESRTEPPPTGTRDATPIASPTTAPGAAFSGERAYRAVQTQVGMGPRIPGSEAHRQTGDWIRSELERAGWTTEVQWLSYRGVELRNVIARGGSWARPTTILGAHYDTRSIADRDTDRPDLPVPGANDGGSGVAILLELARVLRPSPVSETVWLVFFDAEDQGRLNEWEWFVGSRHFAASLTFTPQVVVVIDMVGDSDLQLYYEVHSSREIAESIWRVGASLNYPAFFAEERHAILDDHTSFLERGIPAALVIDFDYPVWHTTQDTPDRVSPRSLEQVGRTLQVWLTSSP
jgi:glutaminyl-peptide cyclotransferase